MIQVRKRTGQPISKHAVMFRRGLIPTQPYRLRSMPRFPWQVSSRRTFPGSVMLYQGPDQLEGFLDIVKRVGGAVVGAVKGVFRDSTVTMPGGVEVAARDLPRVLKGSSVRFGKTPSAAEQLVEQVPGGLGTIATVALVGLGAMLLMGARRRG